MHLIEHVTISDEVWETRFACDLPACHGVCCRDGDLGAPITDEEAERLQSLLPSVKKYLTREQFSFLSRYGVSERYEGKLHIKEIAPYHPCPFGFHDRRDVLLCSLHALSNQEHKSSLAYKPLWCNLYPLVIRANAVGWTINMIQSAACRTQQNSPPILLFFAPQLGELFGSGWVDQLREAYQRAGVLCHK